jgi:hypothetical protein
VMCRGDEGFRTDVVEKPSPALLGGVEVDL